MTAIDRTAYPRFKSSLTTKELNQFYTPTAEEIALARANARGQRPLLSFLVLLKAFQRLGYFPNLREVPRAIKNHIRDCLVLPADQSELPTRYPPRSLYRYHTAIRHYLKVNPFNPTAEQLITNLIETLARQRNNPADLINASLELLLKEHYELPAFSTLDHLVQRLRTQVNNQLCDQVASRLFSDQRQKLDQLLSIQEGQSEPAWTRLKAVPKSASLSHLQDLQQHYQWLLTFGDLAVPLGDLAKTKIKDFAALARTLKPSELADYLPARRYTLILCALQQARYRTRDNLVETFLKRMAFIHNKAKEELAALRERQRAMTEKLLGVLSQLLLVSEHSAEPAACGQAVQALIASCGGYRQLQDECEAIAAYNDNNYYPLLNKYYQSHRASLFRLLHALEFNSTSQDKSMTQALKFLSEHEQTKVEQLDYSLDLSFISELWRRLVVVMVEGGELKLRHRPLEICIFSYLASELKSGDIAVTGSEQYADYRQQLLSWDECQPQLTEYCQQTSLPTTASEFVTQLKQRLTETAQKVDQTFPTSDQFKISPDHRPVLKKVSAKATSPKLPALEAALRQRMPVRSVLEILTNVHYYTGWTRHFSPLGGTDSKLERAAERYILTTFGYGCNLGAAQLVRHLVEPVTAQQLTFVNYRHIDENKLEAARQEIVNGYANFELPRKWGDGSRAGADGTKFELNRENLVSEYHIRYGGYGGIAYQYVSDTYIALFSRFISCGMWEAVYVLDLLVRNQSDLQPDKLHTDTQGQSTPVFGLAYLLGAQLMPRIRNWQDLKFFRPTATTKYQHIDSLFSEVVNWELIERHWQDLMRVALSIRVGKVLPSTLLRKLNNYSHKNKLYQAARELGRVIRTIFLLEYISDEALRRVITATTNKVEAFNGFCKWLFFGSEGIFGDNDPDEQQKRLEYLHLVANAVIYQNVVDMSRILAQLAEEGLEFGDEEVMALSPYLTRHIKRFGDYVLDLSKLPEPFDGQLRLKPPKNNLQPVG